MLSPALVPLSAQTNVQRYEASRGNQYGIVYALPMTELEVEVQVESEFFTPGPLAVYSRRFLAQDVKTEPSKKYTMKAVRINSHGVKDTHNQYRIEFRPGTVAPYVFLTNDDILLSVNMGDGNAKYLETSKEDSFTAWARMPQAKPIVTPTLPQEYALATSEVKRAEIAAAYLYEIRGSMVDVMKGNLETMPRDGAALELMMNALREQEAATLALFHGYTETSRQIYRTRILPEGAINRRTLFRFSEILGPMPADEYAGSPVVLDIQITRLTAPQTDEELNQEEKGLKGLVYRIPGKALVELSYEGSTLIRQSIELAQFGHRASLATKLFKPRDNESIQITFDAATGAITNINNDK